MSDASHSIPDPGTMCSALMTFGARRRRKGGGKASYTVDGRAKRTPCPKFATRFVGGKPYCDQHGPSKFRIDPFYDSVEWRKLRAAVLNRDERICQYCGAGAEQADHVVPRGKGGADALDNLVACCRTCNKTAAGHLFSSFAKKKAWVLANRPIPKERPTHLLDRWNREIHHDLENSDVRH